MARKKKKDKNEDDDDADGEKKDGDKLEIPPPPAVHRHTAYYDLRMQLRSGYRCELSDPSLPAPRRVILTCKNRKIKLVFADTQSLARENNLKELKAAISCRGGSPDTRYGILLDKHTAPAIRIYVESQERQVRIVALLQALREIKPRSAGNKLKEFFIKGKRDHRSPPNEVVEEFVSCPDLQAYVFNMLTMATDESAAHEDLEDLLQTAEKFPLAGMKPDLVVTRVIALGLMEYFFEFELMPLADDRSIWENEIIFTDFYESLQMLLFIDVRAMVGDDMLFDDEREFISREEFEAFLVKSQRESRKAVSIKADRVVQRMPFTRPQSGDTPADVSIFGFMNYLASPANGLRDPRSEAVSNNMQNGFSSYWISTSYMHYRSLEVFQEIVPHCRCFCFDVRLVSNNLMVQLVDSEYFLAEILTNLNARAFEVTPYPVLCLFFNPSPRSVQDEIFSLCSKHLGRSSLWQEDLSTPDAAKNSFILGIFSNDKDPSLWTGDVAINPFCLNEPRVPMPITWQPTAEISRPVAPEPVRKRDKKGTDPEPGKESPRTKKKGIWAEMTGWGKKRPSVGSYSCAEEEGPEAAAKARSPGGASSVERSSSPRIGSSASQLPSADSPAGSTKIDIVCHSAEGLPKAGAYKSRDTFVYITVATEKANGTFTDTDVPRHKTPIVKKSVNPQYDFRCSIEIPRSLESGGERLYVRFVIMQDNLIVGRQKLGEAVCALDVIAERSGDTLSFPVFPVDKDKKAAANAQECPVLSATLTKQGSKRRNLPDLAEGSHSASPFMLPRPVSPTPSSPSRSREGSLSPSNRLGSSRPRPRRFEGVHGAPPNSRGYTPASSSDAPDLRRSPRKLFEGSHRSADGRFFVLNDHVTLQGVTTPYSVKDWSVEPTKLVLSFPICMRNAPRSVQNPASHWGHGVSLVSHCPGVSAQMDALHRGWFQDNGCSGYVAKPPMQELRLQRPQTMRLSLLGGRLLEGRICVKVELRAEMTSVMQTEYARPKCGCHRWETQIEMVANKPQSTLLSITVLRQSGNVLQPEVVHTFCAPLRVCRQGVRWLEIGNWAGILVKLSLS